MFSATDAMCYFMMPSFEPRSVTAVTAFVQAGGDPSKVRTLALSDAVPEMEPALQSLTSLGIARPPLVNRLSSRELWNWVWGQVKDIHGSVILDCTCFTRELVGMLLFAFSVRRSYLDGVQIQYVSTGPLKYATQNSELAESERWLTKGVIGIRSIVGYPGNFSSEKRRRVVALAGHEHDRLLEILEFLEPNELSISNEQFNSSTVEGAAVVSERVAASLRDKIALPSISAVEFSADSIDETYTKLSSTLASSSNENIALVSMNTKLSFVGSALAALHNRDIRMVYAVPEFYNPLYSKDSGDFKSFDITELIKRCNTQAVS